MIDDNYDYKEDNEIQGFEKIKDCIWLGNNDRKYYFSDETENFNGPFKTQELAELALK